MKQRQCLIIEDSDPDVMLLQEYLTRLPFFQPAQVCRTVAEAIVLMQEVSFDLIFLDMRLPDQTGIDFIRSVPRRVPIIVTTAYADFAVEAFDLDVADYLLKPYTFQRFTRALNRALSVQFVPNSLAEHQFIFIKVGHTVQRFDYTTTDFVQAFGTYCKVSSQGKVTVVNEIISNLENLLPKQQFLRIHKSYIINLTKITSYNYRGVYIGSTLIPLGAAYREKFEGFLSLLEKK